MQNPMQDRTHLHDSNTEPHADRTHLHDSNTETHAPPYDSLWLKCRTQADRTHLHDSNAEPHADRTHPYDLNAESHADRTHPYDSQCRIPCKQDSSLWFKIQNPMQTGLIPMTQMQNPISQSFIYCTSGTECFSRAPSSHFTLPHPIRQNYSCVCSGK